MMNVYTTSNIDKKVYEHSFFGHWIANYFQYNALKQTMKWTDVILFCCWLYSVKKAEKAIIECLNQWMNESIN